MYKKRRSKTHLAKKLADEVQFLGMKMQPFVQVDMSEYMEKFNVSKLVGAPPGYTNTIIYPTGHKK